MTTQTLKTLTQTAYEARRDRQVNPEGKFDGAGRWYPSQTEDADGSIERTHRSPSRAWPYSYMTACRTRKHVKALVERALAGLQVPSDIASIVRAALATESTQAQAVA